MDTCRHLVGERDYDRYLMTMAAPAAVRPGLLALFAFNYELARTREAVSDIHAGYIRLAWWSEAVEHIAANEPVPNHDIAQSLARAAHDYHLPADLLESLIEARRFDLEAIPPASMEGMACYAGATNLPLLQLAQRMTGSHVPEDALKHLSTAYGLCGLVRSLPFMAQQNRCYLPARALFDIGIMPEQVHLLGPSDKLNSAIKNVVDTAQQHLDAIATPLSGFMATQKKLTQFYLKRITRAGYNPFDRLVHQAVPFLGLRILFEV